MTQSRGVEAEVVAHIGEVELRRLYAQEACSSMFEYCRRILRLRENEAYLRITVARAARENPALLEMLRDERLHLSGIARLAPHLTRQNSEAVLKRACGMSHREIRELVSELEPKPDVAPSIRKLPQRPAPGNGPLVPQSAHGIPANSGRPELSPTLSTSSATLRSLARSTQVLATLALATLALPTLALPTLALSTQLLSTQSPEWSPERACLSWSPWPQAPPR